MTSRTLLFLLLVGARVVLAQQPSPLIANVEHRKTMSLNGDWHATVDVYDTGAFDYRAHPLGETSFFHNAKPKNERDLVEYDFDKSSTLTVPGDWNTQRDSL